MDTQRYLLVLVRLITALYGTRKLFRMVERRFLVVFLRTGGS